MMIIKGDYINPDGEKKLEITESENLLLKELYRGIDFMKNGRTMPHGEAMQFIRENLEE